MKKIQFWLRGYIIASVKNISPERFINISKNHNIQLYKIYAKEEHCWFQVSREEYKKLLPVARKTGCYPKIRKKSGGYYVLKNLLKQSGIVLGIMAFFLLISILSKFIWQIEFSGNHLHTEEQLRSNMEEWGIGFGTRSAQVDCADLEAKVREKFTDIGWVSVEIHGSKMVVRLRETNFQKKEMVTAGDTDIVASQNGIISEIVTRSGTPQVTVGEAVQKGDVLIAGVVHTVNENNELINRIPVHADGDIIIKTELRYEDEVPLEFQMTKLTGKQKKGCSLSMFGRKIFSYIPSIPYEKYDIINEMKNIKISKNLYLPISYDTIYCREYTQSDAMYSNSQLSEICYRRFLDSMETYLEAGYHIIKEDVSLGIEKDICRLQGSVIMEGPFWERAESVQDKLEGVTAE